MSQRVINLEKLVWQKWLCLHNVRVANRAVRVEIPSLMGVKTKELHTRIVDLQQLHEHVEGVK